MRVYLSVHRRLYGIVLSRKCAESAVFGLIRILLTVGFSLYLKCV